MAFFSGNILAMPKQLVTLGQCSQCKTLQKTIGAVESEKNVNWIQVVLCKKCQEANAELGQIQKKYFEKAVVAKKGKKIGLFAFIKIKYFMIS
jgi:hypothetical protein